MREPVRRAPMAGTHQVTSSCKLHPRNHNGKRAHVLFPAARSPPPVARTRPNRRTSVCHHADSRSAARSVPSCSAQRHPRVPIDMRVQIPSLPSPKAHSTRELPRSQLSGDSMLQGRSNADTRNGCFSQQHAELVSATLACFLNMAPLERGTRETH